MISRHAIGFISLQIGKYIPTKNMKKVLFEVLLA
jgi:hypothetical protein